MALNYSKVIVFASYHFEDPSDYAPSTGDIEAWDQELFDQYDTRLVQSLQAEGLDVNRRNKSRLLMLALMSNGQSPGVRVNNGMRFLRHVTALNV